MSCLMMRTFIFSVKLLLFCALFLSFSKCCKADFPIHILISSVREKLETTDLSRFPFSVILNYNSEVHLPCKLYPDVMNKDKNKKIMESIPRGRFKYKSLFCFLFSPFGGVTPSVTNHHQQFIDQQRLLQRSCGLTDEDMTSCSSRDPQSNSQSSDWRNTYSAARILDFSEPPGSVVRVCTDYCVI